MKAVSLNSANSTGTVSFLGLTLQPRSIPEMNKLVEQEFANSRNGSSRTTTCIVCTCFTGTQNCANSIRTYIGPTWMACRWWLSGASMGTHCSANNG